MGYKAGIQLRTIAKRDDSLPLVILGWLPWQPRNVAKITIACQRQPVAAAVSILVPIGSGWKPGSEDRALGVEQRAALSGISVVGRVWTNRVVTGLGLNDNRHKSDGEQKDNCFHSRLH